MVKVLSGWQNHSRQNLKPSVNLTESKTISENRTISEMSNRAWLYRITFVMLIDMRRPILIVGRIIPWAEDLGLHTAEKCWACIQPSLHLTVDAMWPAPSGSCHYNFLAMVDCTLEVWFRIYSFFLELLLSGYFITTIGKENKTLSIHLSTRTTS